MYVRMFLPICSRTWRRQGQRHTRASRGLQTPTRRPVLNILSVMRSAPWQNLKKSKPTCQGISPSETSPPPTILLRNLLLSDSTSLEIPQSGEESFGITSRHDRQRKMPSSKKSTHSDCHQWPISHLSCFSVHRSLWMADLILAPPSTFWIKNHLSFTLSKRLWINHLPPHLCRPWVLEIGVIKASKKIRNLFILYWVP